jgi:alanine-synthesizing transaminase
MPRASLAERIKLDLPPSVFAELIRMKAGALAEGRKVHDLGIGNPGVPPSEDVLEALVREVKRAENHKYAADNGSRELKEAQAAYYDARFGVALDPGSEIVATSGAHEAFVQLARLITRPGDRVLVPYPCYPVHETGFTLAGATAVPLPAMPADAFLAEAARQVDAHPDETVAMVVSYPHNPTTATVDLAFYEKVIAFAQAHDLFVISDLAYAELYFGEAPHSILEIEGAKARAVELTSLSKTFSVPGWRVGLCSGHAGVCAALKSYKSHLDYGIFPAVQKAAAEALRNYAPLTEVIRGEYRSRREAFLRGLGSHAGSAACESSMFAWLTLPGSDDGASMRFAKALFSAEDVMVSPGAGFGPFGEGHARVALIEDPGGLEESGRRIARFLSSYES